MIINIIIFLVIVSFFDGDFYELCERMRASMYAHILSVLYVYTHSTYLHPILFQHIHHSTNFNLKFSHSE